ncbi:DUF202 domain-containing protein [Nocardia shimofusensis]|uniref:DUF202 domain-containing protein n=1 Tax=Nocardia shimofusensis TaxID=228596 RepID=UPI0008301D59|nr:DUF202 domain-containing protein [Nocardia shimofusensis]
MERTTLAWYRTACSLMIFELVGVRITAELRETASTVLLMVLTVPTLVLIVTGVPRSATSGHRLAVGRNGVTYVRSPDGRRSLLLSLLVATLGVMCLLAVLLGGPGNPLDATVMVD